jgi:transcriptional repressor NF-X1
VPCAEDSYSRVSTALLAARLQEEPINLSELVGRAKKLECNDECYKLLRNAGLAEALQINNPELSSRVVPRYSDYLKEWARRDPALCTSLHAKLTDLVKLALESKHKSRSFSFPNMNRDKRQLVHEYGQHFGVTTQSFDSEPNRNVIATAERAKVSLPSVSLLEAAGGAQRKRAPMHTAAAGRDQPASGMVDLRKAGSQSEPVDWFG